MKPIVTIKRMEKKIEIRDRKHGLVEVRQRIDVVKQSPTLDCVCNSMVAEESPEKTKIVEPLTAPF